MARKRVPLTTRRGTPVAQPPATLRTPTTPKHQYTRRRT
jgi:hypothetical protein